MSEVETFIRRNLLAGVPEARPRKRVTVRLDETDFERLTKIADALGDSPTGTAEELISAAIADAWKVINDGKPQEGSPEGANMARSGKPGGVGGLP